MNETYPLPDQGADGDDLEGGYLDIELYPPPISYDWFDISKLNEEQQARLHELATDLAPNYRPQGFVVLNGRIEEQKIVDFALTIAMADLAKNRRDFPMVSTRHGTASAIASIDCTVTREDGTHQGFVFLQHTLATSGQYYRARSMYLEETNRKLKSIKRNQIPPDPFS